MGRRLLIILWIFSGLIPVASAQKNETSLTRILFIFDASNSMNAPWEGSSRIEIARRILQESVDSLRHIPNLELALRIYGHQTPLVPGQQDCNDTKLEVAFAEKNHDLIKGWIRHVVPKGTTPIARSLEKAGGDFPECHNCRNIIVLITDGIEACDEDPCAIARALRSKNISVKPFIIGVGLNADYLKALECIGTVFDAANEEVFRNVLNTVVSEALNNTTAQIDLLDISNKPTETNVSYTLYDNRTGAIKYNYVHTLDRYRRPDTLQLDPLITYRLVVHTLPKVEKKGIRLTPGQHNIIEAETPRGILDLKMTGSGRNPVEVKCIVRKHKEMQTLHVQSFQEKQKYLVGTYDLEVLTLPRIYIANVEIKQSLISTIEIPFPGTLDLNTTYTGYGALFVVEKGEMKWVCDISDEKKKQFISLQPGHYKIVYRSKRTERTLYSFEKSFVIQSNQTTVLSL